MRHIIAIILLAMSFSAHAITYYVATTGTDGGGIDGGIATPWKTISYACTRVTTSGDTIHIHAGTFTETVQSLLMPGVSIVGEGIQITIIHSNITANETYTISLSSLAVGTAGNQSISEISMISDLDAYGAILVCARSGVEIYNCEFEDFFSRGVVFIGQTRWADGAPATYATGNIFHDNIVTNCADYTGSGKYGNGEGNIGIGGQSGMLIYNNTVIQSNRGIDANGYPIKFYNDGYLKGVKIYNNTLIKPPYDGSTWDIAVELWNCRGGMEIYDNIIKGSLDFGGNSAITNDAGGYGFALKVYRNVIGQDALQAAENNGIYLERGHTGGAYIYNNMIKNVNNALQCYQYSGDIFEDVYFYYNIINNVGIAGMSWNGNAIAFSANASTGVVYDNINFLNNVFYAGISGLPASGIRFILGGTCTNLTIRNNIIQGFGAYPIYTQGGTINTASIQNNIFYLNAGTDNSNPYYHVSTTLISKTESGNIKTNPLFLELGSSFRPQSSSPARNAGLSQSVTSTDYDGTSIVNPPDIGAYEHIPENPAVVPTVMTLSVTNVTKTTSTVSGAVTDDGGGTVSERGVVWDTAINPTTADTKITTGAGTGSYASYVSGLAPNTKYYIRSYATNEAGTSYGVQKTVTTPLYVFIVR